MKPRKLHYVVYEQDGAFVAQCLDVDVASEGDTEAEAVSNLGEALELYFESDAPTTMPPRALRFGELVATRPGRLSGSSSPGAFRKSGRRAVTSSTATDSGW